MSASVCTGEFYKGLQRLKTCFSLSALIKSVYQSNISSSYNWFFRLLPRFDERVTVAVGFMLICFLPACKLIYAN